MLKAILACDNNWGIGKDNDLPWPHNSADLQWFKECTDGGIVVMGRNTWDSLPRKPLPNRENVVITTAESLEGPDVVVDMRSFLKILPQMKRQNKDIWVIGGAKLIQSLSMYIEEYWISRIDGHYECDTFLDGDGILKYYYMDKSINNNVLNIEIYKLKR